MLLYVLKIFEFALRYGLINTFYHILSKKVKKARITERISPGGSSVTDSDYQPDYVSFCNLAVSDIDTFNNFRSLKPMVEAIDHVTFQQGKKYVSEILASNSWSEEYTKVVKVVDGIGNSRKYRFKPYGVFSPTVIRYLKVYNDLVLYFGKLNSKNIAEIGVGWGGQASIIQLINKPLTYSLFDLPAVLDLTKKFLRELSIEKDLYWHDGRNPSPVKPDLVISNYAFSELSKQMQDKYLENVILPSPQGYITWSTLSEQLLGGYKLADLVRIIPGSQILPEIPYTCSGNCIIIWGSVLGK